MAPLVDKDVLGLQVTVENVMFVQVLNCEDDFSDEQLGLLSCEILVSLDQVEQVSAWA